MRFKKVFFKFVGNVHQIKVITEFLKHHHPLVGRAKLKNQGWLPSPIMVILIKKSNIIPITFMH